MHHQNPLSGAGLRDRTVSLTVDQYAGDEFRNMYHCTDLTAAKAIVKEQRFRDGNFYKANPGMNHGANLVGCGVYLTRDKAKALVYQNPKGTGPVLQCRVKLGACIKLHDNDPLIKDWHDHCVPCRGCTRPGGKCVENGPRYNSAWKPAGVKGGANHALEENCVFNTDRIDRIEIIEGQGQGMGPEFWPQHQVAPEKQETAADRISQIGRAAGFVWVWKDDREWRPYTREEAERIERAYQKHETQVDISRTHAVNLDRMVQMRRDDPSRTRQIERTVDLSWAVASRPARRAHGAPTPGALLPIPSASLNRQATAHQASTLLSAAEPGLYVTKRVICWICCVFMLAAIVYGGIVLVKHLEDGDECTADSECSKTDDGSPLADADAAATASHDPTQAFPKLQQCNTHWFSNNKCEESNDECREDSDCGSSHACDVNWFSGNQCECNADDACVETPGDHRVCDKHWFSKNECEVGPECTADSDCSKTDDRKVGGEWSYGKVQKCNGNNECEATNDECREKTDCETGEFARVCPACCCKVPVFGDNKCGALSNDGNCYTDR